MPKYWQYTFDYIINQFAGMSTFFQPMNLLFFIIYIFAGIFLIALLIQLYKNYKETNSTDILLFLLGLLLLLISNVIFIFRRFAYESIGAWELGDALTIILQFPSDLGVLFINIFATRVTFPKRDKIVFSTVFVIIIIKWIFESLAIIQGPPSYNVINLDIVYSFEYAILRLLFLLPIYSIPPTVFFYYSIKIRKRK